VKNSSPQSYNSYACRSADLHDCTRSQYCCSSAVAVNRTMICHFNQITFLSSFAPIVSSSHVTAAADMIDGYARLSFFTRLIRNPSIRDQSLASIQTTQPARTVGQTFNKCDTRERVGGLSLRIIANLVTEVNFSV